MTPFMASRWVCQMDQGQELFLSPIAVFYVTQGSPGVTCFNCWMDKGSFFVLCHICSLNMSGTSVFIQNNKCALIPAYLC